AGAAPGGPPRGCDTRDPLGQGRSGGPLPRRRTGGNRGPGSRGGTGPGRDRVDGHPDAGNSAGGGPGDRGARSRRAGRAVRPDPLRDFPQPRSFPERRAGKLRHTMSARRPAYTLIEMLVTLALSVVLI